MTAESVALGRQFVVRLDSHEDVLQSIRQTVAENNIRTGIILNGIGSVSRYRVHVVETADLPPGDVFFEDEDAYDVLSITGFIIDGRVHAHITLSNTQKALGGHLEEGCRVLTFVVLTIAETPDVQLTDWDAIW
ncbi:MAG TPA: DNA-binding protein [Candidatus Hydrogenedentes bacterium]|nr:DNA-binding protein [Candidatus Hydrogenedentota bacterium]